MAAAEQPISPRTFDVSFDIGAPRQQVMPQAEPDRVSQRLSDAERRLDRLEGNLAALAGALNGNGSRYAND